MSAEPATWTCPSCSNRLPGHAVLCVRCGFHRTEGRRLGPSVLPAGITPPPVSDDVANAPPAFVFRRPADPKFIPWFEVGAPLLGVFVAIPLLGIHIALTPSTEMLREILRLILFAFTNNVLLVACVLIASHWGAVEFGQVHRGILKCTAVVLLTLAALTLVEPFMAHIVFRTLPTGSPIISGSAAVLSILIQLFLPLGLLKFFFQLNLVELVTLVAAQFAVTYASALLLGLWL